MVRSNVRGSHPNTQTESAVMEQRTMFLILIVPACQIETYFCCRNVAQLLTKREILPRSANRGHVARSDVRPSRLDACITSSSMHSNSSQTMYSRAPSFTLGCSSRGTRPLRSERFCGHVESAWYRSPVRVIPEDGDPSFGWRTCWTQSSGACQQALREALEPRPFAT